MKTEKPVSPRRNQKRRARKTEQHDKHKRQMVKTSRRANR